MIDGGYDVSDYCDVVPTLGTLADAEAPFAAAHRNRLRVIIDLVGNHTSDAHPWFRSALEAGPGSPERSRYLFRDGCGKHGELPPNNSFGSSAWTRVVEPDGQPGQWYLHTFSPGQPDLDWTGERVRADFDDILSAFGAVDASATRVPGSHDETRLVTRLGEMSIRTCSSASPGDLRAQRRVCSAC